MDAPKSLSALLDEDRDAMPTGLGLRAPLGKRCSVCSGSGCKCELLVKFLKNPKLTLPPPTLPKGFKFQFKKKVEQDTPEDDIETEEEGSGCDDGVVPVAKDEGKTVYSYSLKGSIGENAKFMQFLNEHTKNILKMDAIFQEEERKRSGAVGSGSDNKMEFGEDIFGESLRAFKRLPRFPFELPKGSPENDGGGVPLSPVKRYYCVACTNSYDTRFSFNSHFSQHRNCSVCGKFLTNVPTSELGLLLGDFGGNSKEELCEVCKERERRVVALSRGATETVARPEPEVMEEDEEESWEEIDSEDEYWVEEEEESELEPGEVPSKRMRMWNEEEEELDEEEELEEEEFANEEDRMKYLQNALLEDGEFLEEEEDLDEDEFLEEEEDFEDEEDLEEEESFEEEEESMDEDEEQKTKEIQRLWVAMPVGSKTSTHEPQKKPTGPVPVKKADPPKTVSGKYACVECNKDFQYRGRYQLHMQRVHETEVELFSCPKCPLKFSLVQDLSAHEETHGETKSFKCDICGKEFSMQSHLDTHRRAHAGEKRYCCGVCGKAFSSLCSVRSHEANSTACRQKINKLRGVDVKGKRLHK